MKLVIVESPAKAETIGKFLGKDYKVAASYGHIRDLPGSAEEIPENIKGKPWSRMAVNVDNGYKPVYVVPKESRKQIQALKKLIKDADEIILATDEDREGESISWHLLEVLKPKVPVKRIAFHEITHSAIDEALANPRNINDKLVEAQESRRVLDRLYGYSLSPVLWKKVRPKLSAGRVQSVAVRLVVEREEERKRFKKSEYWDAVAKLESDGVAFEATLTSVDGKRLAAGKDFDPETGELFDEIRAKESVVWLGADDAAAMAKSLKANTPWQVTRVEQKETKLRPDAPFITSTLQRAASSLLGFAPKRTMVIAQQLYEGVDLGGGSEREGLITYMRTDSVALSEEALRQAKSLVVSSFGENYHERRVYTTKSKMAQEAHEAIRPTQAGRRPESVKAYLDQDQFKLYRLIWNRTIASQMTDAQLLKTTVDIEANAEGKRAVLRANGSVVKFPGFLKVADRRQEDSILPPIKEGDRVVAEAAVERIDGEIYLNAIDPVQHETKPPARYTEAALIQRLEEEGIGRPSTYAPTLSTIQQRGYVVLEGKTLVPTFLAVGTTRMLRDHFAEYVDLGFTARMEDALDDIASGKQDPVEFLEAFYRGKGRFGQGLEPHIENELPKIDYPALELGNDPDTGKPLVVRLGRTSAFVQRGEGGSENTATIPKHLTFEAMDADLAAKLLRDKAKANIPIGQHPDTGENVYTLIGPYGPYVQLGEPTDKNKRPKRASLPKGTHLEDVTLDQALKLLSLPRELGTHPESGEPVTAGIGRFGPYVKHQDDFRSLEAGDDLYTVTLERALALLAQPKKSRGRTKTVLATLGKDAGTDKEIQVCEGRYGPYVTNGSVNATIPKDQTPTDVTLEQATAMLAEAAKKPKRKPKAKRKTKSKAKKSTAKRKPASRPKEPSGD